MLTLSPPTSGLPDPLLEIRRRPGEEALDGQRRLLVVGQGLKPTGFGRVTHSILATWPVGWRLDHLVVDPPSLDFPGLSNAEGHDQQAAQFLGWHVHRGVDRADRLAAMQLRRLAATLRPDAVLMVGEPWMAARHWLPALPPDTITLLHAAVDEVPSTEVLAGLARLHTLAVYTSAGRHALRRVAAGGGRDRPELIVVPPGVDGERFRPLVCDGNGEPDRERGQRRARRVLWRDHPELHDAFVVLVAHRNQPNKRLDLAIEAFARFAQAVERGAAPEAGREHSEDKGPRQSQAKAWLYLHTANRAPREIWPGQPPALVDRWGIRDRVLVSATTTGVDHVHPRWTSTDLGLLYNACDVGLCASEGEGWGLLALEHGATGAAQILPRHSVCAELWSGPEGVDKALLVEPVTADDPLRHRRAGRSVAPASVADALESLYRDTERRHRLGRAAWHLAQRQAGEHAQLGPRLAAAIPPSAG